MSTATNELLRKYALEAEAIVQEGTVVGYYTFLGLLATFLGEVKPLIETDVREQAAAEFVADFVAPTQDEFKRVTVSSESGADPYVVTFWQRATGSLDSFHCTCPDYSYRSLKSFAAYECKHCRTVRSSTEG